MKTLKLTNDFWIHEFVPPDILAQWGTASVWFIDFDIVHFNQWLRDYTGKGVTVNDYYWNHDEKHNYKFSGFRPPSCKIGASLSQHRFKGASDSKIDGMIGEEIRQIIRDNFMFLNERFNITTIEDDTSSWCHIDKRYTGLDRLFVVPYK